MPTTTAPPSIHTLSLPDFRAILARYPALIRRASKPAKPGAGAQDEDLEALDRWRLETLQGVIQERKGEQGGGGWLEKEEVVRLVRWKLKHGTFRPSLLALASSNPPALVVSTTRDAFRLLLSDAPPSSSPPPALAPALKKLVALKGIGPATASLLLSVADPARVPFFSDELFRWAFFEEGRGEGGGWGRKIKYDDKEYGRLVGEVGRVIKRLGGEEGDRVWARDVERVGYVLGIEAKMGRVDGGELGEADGEDHKSGKRKAEDEPAKSKELSEAQGSGLPASKTSGKRQKVEPTRSSTRKR